MLASLVVGLLLGAAALEAADWGQWRGPQRDAFEIRLDVLGAHGVAQPEFLLLGTFHVATALAPQARAELQQTNARIQRSP